MRGLLVAVILILGLGAPAWATEYFSAIADLPVADGLTEQKDKSTVFDAPLGRIVTAYATGKADVEDVLDFYAAERRRVFLEVTSPMATNFKRTIQESDPARRKADREGFRATVNDDDKSQTATSLSKLIFGKPMPV